jgi:hypothetical protein
MSSISTLEQRILDSMLARWGYVIGGVGLRQALGFPTQAALRQAILRGSVPVKLFSMNGRRGHFALTHEVSQWLASQSSNQAEATHPQQSNSARRIVSKNK